jgi:hypothetical protein
MMFGHHTRALTSAVMLLVAFGDGSRLCNSLIKQVDCEQDSVERDTIYLFFSEVRHLIGEHNRAKRLSRVIFDLIFNILLGLRAWFHLLRSAVGLEALDTYGKNLFCCTLAEYAVLA